MEKQKQTYDRVSIITPCWNGEKYIGETIESVLAQTVTDWEMIIVDDGSSDHSAQVVQTYVDQDERIRLICQENAGSSAARNHGIREATGRYIALLDADDVWEDNFLEEQLKLMQEKDAACVYSSYRLMDENSKVYGHVVRAPKELTYKKMCVRNYIGCLTGLYDTRAAGKIYLREELKSLRDDYAFWLDCVAAKGIAYGNPEPLARYRVLASSTTGNKKKLIRVQWRFYREYLKLGWIKSLSNLLRWGVYGVFKFR
ncbi:MAG: glycosyltransferase [Lachnospiraceae bacterium]|nr:glycosyltransferase [Lachnospiraceae bacterium]